MAQEYVKISELESTASFGTADQFVIVQNEETVKIAGTALIQSMVTLTNLATRSYVDAVVDSAPGTLDTLRELAAALNDDDNFGATITNLINEKLPISDFGLEFWNQLATVNTYHIGEGSNLYWTQERFDSALSTKNTFQIAEGSNLYFTEQRVLDVVLPLIPTSFVTSFNDLIDKPTIPTDINQLTDVYELLGQGGSVEADRLISGEVEVVLQSNGSIRLANGAQLYDYGLGAGNGYGITDAVGSTYIGYNPSLGALHMDSYTGGNIRIRTTDFSSAELYKDWLFDNAGVLSIPMGGDIKRNGVSVLGSSNSFSGSYNDLTNKPTLFSKLSSDLTWNVYTTEAELPNAAVKHGMFAHVHGTGHGYMAHAGNWIKLANYSDVATTPTFTTVTATQLNVQNVAFTGTGAVTIASGNDLNFAAAGNITFNGDTAITKTQLKSIVAASVDFADFKARIAAL